MDISATAAVTTSTSLIVVDLLILLNSFVVIAINVAFVDLIVAGLLAAVAIVLTKVQSLTLMIPITLIADCIIDARVPSMHFSTDYLGDIDAPGYRSITTKYGYNSVIF